MGNTVEGYHKVIGALRLVRYHAPDDVTVRNSVQAVQMKGWMIVFICSGVFLILIAVGSFLILFYFDYLDWTFLSNNFCLITITMFSGLYLARVNLAVVGIQEDHYKVVLWEATLAIKDACLTKAFDKEMRQNNVRWFVDALSDTKVFDCPQHIRQRNIN